MTQFKTLDDLHKVDGGNVHGKVVLVRVDLNLPMQDGAVTDDTRVRAAAPTVLELADAGAKVLLLAHFGRPKGERSSTQSLSMVVSTVESVLGREVMFCPEIYGPVVAQVVGILPPGGIALLENTRFWKGEEANDPELAAAIAANADFYVNDAFSAAHRAHATTEGLAHVLPSFAGRSMEAELVALGKALDHPERPVAAVVGGAKVSSKLDVLRHLVDKVDHLIIGGGMANTFLAARGVAVGKSLCEHDLTATADEIMVNAEKSGCTVHLPYDVAVSKEFAANPASFRVCNVHEVEADEMILDVGPAAVEALADVLKTCRTLVWNGPMGAFEMEPFDTATVALARTAAALTKEGSLISVAGGGDTVAALNLAGVAGDFTYVSTAGGAFLEWMEGRVLPGVAALEA
ncbi:phosphoglycerate kinase [Novosphingobium sp. Chol11]|uniref:phosphoglycerate kinase n=1 Tax=Novosphingobium sp. Chol11 TaxID=1385763 RepID=UPI0025EBC308|nr:phosphoglycerate kinase [Novosphingobium sp. Chol11]